MSSTALVGARLILLLSIGSCSGSGGFFSVRVDVAQNPLGHGGHGPVHPADHRVRRGKKFSHKGKTFPHADKGDHKIPFGFGILRQSLGWFRNCIGIIACREFEPVLSQESIG